MNFKTKNVTINSAQIVFTLQNTNMQTFNNLLVFKVYFNCCKVEGHHLPPQMKNDPDNKSTTTIKAQKRSKDIVKTVHVTSVVQPSFNDAQRKLK